MNTTQTLNSLIEICKDGQDGYRDAAENSKHPDLKKLLLSYSLQRSKFAGELQQLVISLGEKPEDSSSVASAIHRGWIDLKAAFTKGSDHAILAECERGEDLAVSAYSKALETKLPAHIHETVSAQSDAILDAHNDIRDRRNASAE